MTIERYFYSGLSTLALLAGVWGLLDGQDIETLLRGGFMALLGATGLSVEVIRAMRGDVRSIRWSVDRAADAYLRSVAKRGGDDPPPRIPDREDGVMYARTAQPPP